MRMKRWVAVLWACSVWGCAHSTPSSGTGEVTPRASLFYPLGVGHVWTYQTQLLGGKKEIVVRVLREEGGYFVDTQGGQLRVDSAGVRDHQRYLLQEPIREGNTWTNVLSANEAEHYRILSVGASCEAPAGKFEGCVQVEGRTLLGNSAGTLVILMTFAPEVGLVRSEVVLESQGKRTLQSQLLLKSHLPPPSGSAPASAR
jgi:hypothetical protein